MTDWFAHPVLHVTDVDSSLRFYVNQLGFTSPWRYDEDGRPGVAQVDRHALILADKWVGTQPFCVGCLDRSRVRWHASCAASDS